MVELSLSQDLSTPQRILCLGAHPDDIEIGCGATLLKLMACYPSCEVKWVVFSGNEARRKEAAKGAKLFLKKTSESVVETRSYRDGFFPDEKGAIKEYFEEELKSFRPTLIFTHYGRDAHQDHRVISELTWNTFRNHLILEYEVLKYDGDLGRPNVFVEVSEDHCRAKINHLMDAFPSQSDKHWFTEDAFWAMLRIRGVEAGSASKFAEAFYGRKLLLG